MNRHASLPVFIAGCLVLATFSSVRVASAQAASSFRDLQGSLKGGDRLIITEQSGGVMSGRFVALSDTSLRVSAESRRAIDLAEASVRKIEHLRPRKGKGALMGFAAGFVGGLLAVGLTPDNDRCCGPGKGFVLLPAAAIFGGIGAAIGAGVGATRPDHRLVYLAAGNGPDVP